MAPSSSVGGLVSSSTHPFRSTVVASIVGALVGFAGLGLLSSAISTGRGSGGGDGWLRPTARSAVVASNGLLYEASHEAAAAAKESKDPATAAMVQSLTQAHLRSMPPLPVGHLFDRHAGYLTVHMGKGLASGQVLLEVPKKLMDTPFMIISLVTSGDAQYSLMGNPGNNIYKTVFAFRKSEGLHDSLDLYRPLMELRNEKANSSMAVSLRDGYFPGWVRSFPVRSFRDSYLLDATSWVTGGMNVFSDNDGRQTGLWELSSRLVKGMAYPRNVELDVQVRRRSLLSLGQSELSPENMFSHVVRYSILALPDKPMETREADTRIGYFGTSFISADDTDGGSLKRTFINRWNLDKGPITFHIDPSVPVEWRPSVKSGVVEWDKAFAKAGHPGSVRAVLPGDKDWPADYSLGDARYSVISWAPNLGPAYAMGPSDPDPRTGEILRGTVMLGGNFVQAVARDVHEGVAGIAKMDPTAAVSPEKMEREEGEMRARSLRMLGVLAAAEADEVATVTRPAVAAWERMSDAQNMAVMGAPAAGVLTAVLEQTMKELTMHEIGHVLGLRHNFRASSTVPFAKLSDRAWVEANGTSASVMDYLPTIIRENPADQVTYASPTIGAYDYAAIKYGYGSFKSDDARLSFAQMVSKVSPFATDNDEPSMAGDDPLTSYRDLSDSPLEYFAETFAVSRKVMRLAKASTTKTAGAPWLDFSVVADDAIQSGFRSMMYAAKFIGGRVPSRSSSTGSPSAPVALVDVATEKRALTLLLRELDPRKGLFGSGMVQEYGAHMVFRRCFGSSSSPTQQCLGVRAAPLVSTLNMYRRHVLSMLLMPFRLTRLAEAAVMDPSRAGLTVTELLRAVTATFFGHDGPVDDLHRDAQALWVQILLSSVEGNSSEELSPLAMAALVAELNRIHAMVSRGGGDPHLLGLAQMTSKFSA